MHLSGREDVVHKIMSQAIPMHGRMIHGRDLTGNLWQAAQAYDVHGQVGAYSIDKAARCADKLGHQLNRQGNPKQCTS